MACINTSGKRTPSSGVPGLYKTAPNPYLETTNWDWNIDPCGLRRFSSRHALPITIAENGLGEFDRLDVGDRIRDDYRIAYLKAHIVACQGAISDGVDLLGYCA